MNHETIILTSFLQIYFDDISKSILKTDSQVRNSINKKSTGNK